MNRSTKQQKGFITLLLLVSLICLPIIAWAGLSTSSDAAGDASIILAMDYEEEEVDDVEPDADDAEMDDDDVEPDADDVEPDADDDAGELEY